MGAPGVGFDAWEQKISESRSGVALTIHSMTFLRLDLFFPVVLAAHNMEKCARPLCPVAP